MSTAPGALVRTPEPPYYAVIFTSKRTAGDHGYGAMADRMVELGATQDGFLGIESARGADGLGITVSYWRDEAAILAWKRNAEHQRAQAGQGDRRAARRPGADSGGLRQALQVHFPPGLEGRLCGGPRAGAQQT